MAKLLLRKALIIQSLFFYGFLYAQNIYIDQPERGAALSDTQEFKVSVTDARATRVDFYLNNRLIQAKTKEPYLFRAGWNTNYENTVRFVAHLEGGGTVSVERRFSEIKVDIAETLEVFQFFPFMERPGVNVKMKADNVPVTPDRFEPASQKFNLDLVIALDVSGSMKFSLTHLSAGVHQLLAKGRLQGWKIQFLIFDRLPRLIEPSQVPNDLASLFVGRSRSVIWDSMATSSQLFGKDPRRIMLLISDGRDDGSQHTADSAQLYLKKSRASLIWINPSSLQNEALSQLTNLSGGFAMFTENEKSWTGLITLIDTQYHLQAPEASYPVKLNASQGRIWYPKWAR